MRPIAYLLPLLLLGCALNQRMKEAENLHKAGQEEKAFESYLAIVKEYPEEKKAARQASAIGSNLAKLYETKAQSLIDSSSYIFALALLEEEGQMIREAKHLGINLEASPRSLGHAAYQGLLDSLQTLYSEDKGAMSGQDIAILQGQLRERSNVARRLDLPDPPRELGELLHEWEMYSQYQDFSALLSSGKRAKAIEKALRAGLGREKAYRDSLIKYASLQQEADDSLINQYYNAQAYTNVVEIFESHVRYRNTLYMQLGLKAERPSLMRYQEAKGIIEKEQAELHYQKGLKLYENKRFIGAVEQLQKALALVPGFKDAQQIVNDSKDKAILGVGFLGFKENSHCEGLGAAIASQLLHHTPQNDYIQFLDRAHLPELLDEQALWMTGLAKQEGKPVIQGANWLVMGKVEQCEVEEALYATRSIPAYLISEQTHSHKEGKSDCEINTTSYHGQPVFIQEMEGTKQWNVLFSLKIIDTQSGHFLASQNFHFSIGDTLSYADCGGCETGRLSSTIPPPQEYSDCDGVAGLFVGSLVHELFSGERSPLPRSAFQKRRRFVNSSDMMNSASEALYRQSQVLLNRNIQAYMDELK